MRRMQAIIAGLLLSGVAVGGEVYVTRDASGNPVYTDRPATLPAEKLGVRSNTTDPAEVQARYDEQMKKYAADSDSSAKAKSQAPRPPRRASSPPRTAPSAAWKPAVATRRP
jgi:hypothetical protein